MKTESSSVVKTHEPEVTQQNCMYKDRGSGTIYHPMGYTYGDSSAEYTCPDHSVEYEEHTPNSGGGRNAGWKSYEHYLIRRDDRSNTALLIPQFAAEPPVGRPHYAVRYWSNPRFACTANPGANISLFGEPNFPNAGLFAFYEKRPDDGFIPPPVGLAALEHRAITSMMPGIKAELSVINSLIELKDFKSIPRTVTNVASYFNRVRGRAGQKLRDILQGGSDVYLQTSFNIIPLLSDISGIHSALSSAERRINALIAGAGRKRTRYFSMSLAEYVNPSEEVTSFFRPLEVGNDLSKYRLIRNVTTEPTIFRAEIQYNYMFSEYQIVHAQLLGMLDAFGVNLNPSIIWNALPWSFVVDWVFGVSRWLDQLKVRNLEPRVNIRRYCWSVLRERRIRITREHRSASAEDLVPYLTIPCPVTLERGYRREVKSPSMSSITSSGLNPNEVSLGAALVISRRRRNRNRVRTFRS